MYTYKDKQCSQVRVWIQELGLGAVAEDMSYPVA